MTTRRTDRVAAELIEMATLLNRHEVLSALDPDPRDTLSRVNRRRRCQRLNAA